MADLLYRTRSLIGTPAQWSANDLVLGDGEIGIERGADIKMKVGNGTAKWSALPYVSVPPAGSGEFLPLTGGTLTGPVISTAQEALRIKNDQGFISFYNTAGTERSGGLLFATGGDISLFSENAGDLVFAAGAERMRIRKSTGHIGIYGATDPVMPLQISLWGGLDGNGNEFIVRNNNFWDGTKEARLEAGFATQIGMDNAIGAISFNLSATSDAAGTAANLINRAKLDAAGVLTLTAAIPAGDSSSRVPTTAWVGGELGFVRRVDQSTAGGTLAAAHLGKMVVVTATGALNVPNAVGLAGGIVSVLNRSSGIVTLTATGAMQLYLAGSTTPNNRPIAAGGLATIWFESDSAGVVSGPGVS